MGSTENTTHGPNVVSQQLKIISKELPLITGSRQRTTRRVGQSQKRARKRSAPGQARDERCRRHQEPVRYLPLIGLPIVKSFDDVTLIARNIQPSRTRLQVGKHGVRGRKRTNYTQAERNWLPHFGITNFFLPVCNWSFFFPYRTQLQIG